MKILINTIPLLSPLTGIGKYTLYISKELKKIDKKNSYTYYYGYFTKKLEIDEKNINQKIFHFLKRFIRTTPLSQKIRNISNYLAKFSLKKFDIYFEPNFIILDNIKAKARIVSVFDFSFDKFPQWHPKERIDFFKSNFWKSMKIADRIIVPSIHVLNEATEEYGLDNNLIRKVYPGIDHELFREYPRDITKKILNKYSLPEDYILFVGSIEPRKNLRNLLLAYLSLPEYMLREFKLVIVGFSGWKNKDIIDILEKNLDKITYTGYVSEIDLAYIYSEAKLFIFPTFYEGFGLPPLEAMACGCPVIVSNRASLPEICKEGAIYCEPDCKDNIAETIYKVLNSEDLRNELILKGKSIVKDFRWENTAKEILKIFSEVIN